MDLFSIATEIFNHLVVPDGAKLGFHKPVVAPAHLIMDDGCSAGVIGNDADYRDLVSDHGVKFHPIQPEGAIATEQ